MFLLNIDFCMTALKVVKSFSGLFNVAKLIGCDVGELKQALSTRKMKVGNDNIVQKLKHSQVTISANQQT